MTSFANRLLAEVQKAPGLSDRELTDRLLGKGTHPSRVNQEARLFEGRGQLFRRARMDGRIGNFPTDGECEAISTASRPTIKSTPEGLSEDELKDHIAKWLEGRGWNVKVAWGNARGVDIEASRQDSRWIIEVKGLGSRQPMRVNYFIAILGETQQRMNDPNAKYTIAFPDVPQFRNLWARLPELAKRRTTIGALFVSPDGAVNEEA